MYAFIVNPVSGNGRGKRIWPRIEAELKRKGVAYSVNFTERKGHAMELASGLVSQPGLRAIVAVGGDGTAHEVVNGLMDKSVPFGYIPSGSGNDFARAEGIPIDPLKALKRIFLHRPYFIDTAEINGQRMIGSLGIGFDGQVAQAVNHSKWKAHLGKLSYIWGFSHVLRHFQPQQVSVSIDGKTNTYKGVWLIAITNIPNYGGGMKICPDARWDDGQLDICVVHGISRGKLLALFPSVFRGSHIRYSAVTMKRGKEIHVTSEKPMIVHADGEIIGETPLTIKISPQSLLII